MGTEAVSSVGPGLEHASPELLELFDRITNEISNHTLFQTDEVPVLADDPIESDAAVEDGTKDTKAAAGSKRRSKKEPPSTTDEAGPEAASTAPVDAASAVLERPDPAAEDEFDAQIKAVQAKAEEDLRASIALEQHLIEQHDAMERATAADMAAKDELYTRFWRYSGAPHAPAKLQLDSERIRAAGLVDPTAVLQALRDTQQKTVLNPPVTKAFSDNTALPHYLASTAANRNRESGRQDAIAKCRKSIREGKAFTWHSLPKPQLDAAVKASRQRQKLTSLRMNGDQWDAERRVIQRIQDKLNFTRNPRFQDTMSKSEVPAIQDALMSRPRFGVGVVNKGTKKKPSLTSRADASFVCEPADVLFTDWHPGSVYEAVVQIRNVSATLQRVRVLPATTQYFHVSRLAFPAAEGVIAPGVHGEVRIKFTPDSLADFSDELTVVTAKGAIAVPLIAHRNPPMLEMDSRVSFGAVYVGNSVTREVVVRAHSGGGAFRVVSSRAWTDQAVDVHETDHISLPGGLTISPAHFSLAAGGTVIMNFTFAPIAKGPVEASYMLLCDNCHHRENTVIGRGVEPDAVIVSLDGRPYNHAAGIVRFPSTMPGSCAKRTLTIRNACSAPLPFKWAISNTAPHADLSTLKSHAVKLLPEHGVMAPREEVLFDVLFAPDCCGTLVSAANFEMEPSAVSGTCGDANAAVRRIQLRMEGFSPVHPASVYPRMLRAPEDLEVGSTFSQSFVIKNPADTPAKFRISGASDGPVAASTEEGTVAPRSQEVIRITAVTCEALELEQTLRCNIEHGFEYTVHVCAAFTRYLPVQLLTAGVDFGLVCRGTTAVATLELRNPSLINATLWSVSCVAPAVHTVAIVEAPQKCGSLQPDQSCTVELQCTGVAAGLLHGHARICSHGAVMLMPFRARVVAPHIALGPAGDSFDLGTSYIGVPVTRCLELVNRADVEAHWRLRPRLLGSGADTVHVAGEADSGVLAAGAAQVIAVTVMPQHVGCLDGLLVVDVDHAEHPVIVPVLCSSERLRVEYSVVHGELEGENTAQALDRGLISFGERITVGDVVTLYLTLTNPTGIEAPVAISLDHFAAAGDVTSVSQGMDASSDCLPTNGDKPCRRQLLLGDEHEQKAPFRSQIGADLMATRAVQKAARALLVDRGIAIKLSATEATLPPFGRCNFRLQLVSNCVGSYLDQLHCKPYSNIKPVQVHVQREAAFISGLHKQVSTTIGLDFGAVPQTIPVTRSFHVFNQSSFDVDLQLGVHTWEKQPGARLVDVGLQVQADDHVMLSARYSHCSIPHRSHLSTNKASGNTDCSYSDRCKNARSACRPRTTAAKEYASFTIQPQSVQLEPGMSRKVAVHFSSPLAIHHEAFVLGTQQLRYNAETPTTATIVSHADTEPAELVLRGSFHPHAGPPPAPVLPLKVALSSHCIQARLEHGQRRPLKWVIHRIHGPSAGSRQQTITFCNRTASPLRFHINTQGPFEIVHVVTSVPQEASMYIGSKGYVAAERDEGGADWRFLPPQESVDVTVLCVLAAPKHSTQDCSATGVLRLCFGNGDVQEEGLVAFMLHPRLQCKGKGGAPMGHLDFGRVAVRSCRMLQIVLENPSEVDAVWSADVCDLDAAPSVASTAALAKANVCKDKQEDSAGMNSIVALHGFSAAPGRGLLHGSPPERLCAQAVLRVKFSPDSVGVFAKELRFMTKGGDPCSLTVKGTATLDERDEPEWKQTGLFQ